MIFLDETKRFILSCFSHQRTVRSTTLYHFLSGKKTSSILTYGFLNGILPYFNLFPNLEQREFEDNINFLLENNYLVQETIPLVTITEKGLVECRDFNCKYLDGLSFYKIDYQFWIQLVLLTQVVSEKRYRNSKYIASDANMYHQHLLKQWISVQSNDWLDRFMAEWMELLTLLGKDESYLLSSQLVGHNTPGLTKKQVAEQLIQSEFEIEIRFKNAVHQLIYLIDIHSETFPVFFSLYSYELKCLGNDTVQETFHLYFQKGYDYDQIARQRHLKLSTIYDHLIESVIQLDVSQLKLIIERHQLTELLGQLSSKYPKIRAWTFKDCQLMMSSLNYYEFRLMQFYLIKDDNDGEDKTNISQ